MDSGLGSDPVFAPGHAEDGIERGPDQSDQLGGLAAKSASLTYVLFDVADGALEVSHRLPGLAFRLLAAIAGYFALDLFCLATNLVLHEDLLKSDSVTTTSESNDWSEELPELGAGARRPRLGGDAPLSSCTRASQ